MFKKVFLAFGIISSANAALLSEDSRVFIGAQIGSSWVRLQEKTSSATTNHNHIYANYGILYGYEIYFGDAFGVRGYQMVNIVGSNIVEFGAGADIIWNLAQASQGNFGLIFGGQVYGVYYHKDLAGAPLDGALGFDVALNAGLRYALQNHSFELFAQAPFINNKINNISGIEYYAREPLSIAFRYTYRL